MTWNGPTLTLDVATDLGGNVDLSELRSAIEPLLTPGVVYFVGNDTTVTVELDAEPNQAEKDAVDVAAVAHGVAALDRVKKAKDEEIDTKTEEQIVKGGFLHNAKIFSTSVNAQSKWHAIQIMNLMAQVSFPLLISTKDEESYPIADSIELSTMYATMVGTGKAHHDGGKALKDAVSAATTIAEVDAVVDPR